MRFVWCRGGVRSWFGPVFGVALSVAAPATWAQEAPKTQAPAASTSGTDVVRLKNGGLVRGTISELVPDDYVVIVTLTGEARRFSMSEVSYAGPVAAAPAAEPGASQGKETPATDDTQKDTETFSDDAKSSAVRPEITIHAKEARVKFETPPGFTFHKRTSSAVAVGPGGVARGVGYREICTAPCEVSMAAGTITMGVSKPGGATVEAPPFTLPAGSVSVNGTYVDNTGTRIGGWVLFGVTTLAGIGMMAASFSGDGDLNTGLLFGGLGVMTGGTLIGVIVALTPDSVEIKAASK